MNLDEFRGIGAPVERNENALAGAYNEKRGNICGKEDASNGSGEEEERKTEEKMAGLH